jgi:hypothetical protein
MFSAGRVGQTNSHGFAERGTLQHTGTDFSKFQGVLKFALQILLADNLKGLKTQPTTKSRHQETQGTNGMELQSVHSLMPLLNSKDLLSQNKTDTHNSTGSITYQKCGGGERYGTNTQQKTFLGPN